MSKHRWSALAPLIDIDAFEEAIDFEVIDTDNKGNDIGLCPDLWGLHKHGDTTGKFAIHRHKRVYNCWVCGGGSLLSLAMEMKRLDEDSALDWLKEFASEEGQSNEDFENEIEALMAQEERAWSGMPRFNPRVLERIGSLTIVPWLSKRGITEEVISQFQVRYSPNAERHTKKGDYEGPAIFFPHYWQDRLVGWQTRWLGEDRPKWVKKYTNTTDFPREQTIYNYERVYFEDRPLVLVESVATVLFLASIGVPAICTFGSEISAEQMRLLRRCQQGLILAPDNDKPGRKMARSAAKSLERFVSELRVIPPVGEYDSGCDLGDLSDEPEEVLDLVANAIYMDEYEFDQVHERRED